MNLASLRSQVRVRIGNPSVTDVTDASLNGHVNAAARDVFNKYKFRRRKLLAKFTTTSGSDKYLVAPLTDVIYKVWDRTNGHPLTYVGPDTLAQRDYDGALNQPGKPDKWAFVETYMQLIPVPDGAYVIEFQYKPIYTVLVNDSDAPPIPDNWERGVVILASYMYYDGEARDPTKATYDLNAFRTWVADQPVEEHEQTEAIDSGVQLPTFKTRSSTGRRPDGTFWDSEP